MLFDPFEGCGVPFPLDIPDQSTLARMEHGLQRGLALVAHCNVLADIEKHVGLEERFRCGQRAGEKGGGWLDL